MENNNIFIHIPKTGGTTINSAMNNSYWQTELSFNYRHIDLHTKYSNSGDIFQPENLTKYQDYTILTMLRDPIDRLISEYHFLRERKEFINLLKRPPSSFEDYIKNPQTQNYTVGFLVGKRIYDTKTTRKEDLDKVIQAIDNLPIHVGIFEYFKESLGYFTDVAGIEWNKQMSAKRMTFNRPKKDEISEEIKQNIIENNQLDIELYQHCLSKFLKLKPKYDKTNIDIRLSKYDHIFPYMSKTCLFEFCLDNKHYIKSNFQFFKTLTFFLIKEKGITDGKQLVGIWNQTVIDSISETFPNTEFAEKVKKAIESQNEPLDQLIALGNSIDEFFRSDPKTSKKFYQEMKFNKELVKELKPKKVSLFKKLFG